jgi:FlaG/FlaF family flagellin (archaellin)
MQKKLKNLIDDKRGISSIIATVVLVAVSLVVVVAVAFWLSELVVAFTKLDGISKIFSLAAP